MNQKKLLKYVEKRRKLQLFSANLFWQTSEECLDRILELQDEISDYLKEFKNIDFGKIREKKQKNLLKLHQSCDNLCSKCLKKWNIYQLNLKNLLKKFNLVLFRMNQVGKNWTGKDLVRWVLILIFLSNFVFLFFSDG